MRKTMYSDMTSWSGIMLGSKMDQILFHIAGINNHPRYVKLKSDVAAACHSMLWLTTAALTMWFQIVCRLGFCCLQSEASGVQSEASNENLLFIVINMLVDTAFAVVIR